MVDVDRFRISEREINSTKKVKKSKYIKTKPYRFIKGPIPVHWISEAYKLAPCAIQIGLVIWYVSGLRKSKTIVLSTKMIKEFNLKRHTKYRGLKLLEDAGLIEVERKIRQNPIVTIKERKFKTQNE